MNLFTLISIELKKIRRSHIFWILLIPVILLWIPCILNFDMNFQNAAGVLPEQDFFLQSFLGLSWFMYPATLVVITVMLNQTERSNRAILKMLSLPLSPALLGLAKFAVLLLLAAFQMVLMGLLYFPAAAYVSHAADYNFMLPLLTVVKNILAIYASSIPMAAFYWLLATAIQSPVFSVGLGLASIVPSVLLVNTKICYGYPICYPLYMITNLMSRMQQGSQDLSVELFPWLIFALGITLFCLALACLLFGKSERR